MSKVFKVIGQVASIAAMIPGPHQPFAAAIAATAQIGAQLTANNRPPPVRGSLSQVLISPDAPMPYAMGEGYYAGVLRYDEAYGATLKKVPNPYRWMVMTYSGAGPVQSITPYVDQESDVSYYTGYLDTDTQLGAQPESTALVPPLGTAPGWSSTSKLSGYAAIGWNLKFDKDGKRFAAGLPQLGAYGQWVKVYDPRKDSTYPGGSGSHRLGDESTYEWSERPALHAAMYAYGRYQNGKRVFGAGLPTEAIDWEAVVAWANVCDDNDWKIFGVIYEPMPETRWPNLKDICAAGGAMPIFSGGVLTFHYAAPRVALDTFTEDDLADGNGSVTAMASRRTRLNTIIPKYRSPDHNWEMVATTDTVTSATYVTEDGEERRAEWPFNLVKDKDQASQLAAYVLADGRELQPITLTFGHRVREYRPGECVHLEIPRLALDHDAVILTREFDPASMATTFTFISETAAKHAFALGQTGTAPPTATLTPQTPEERDDVVTGALLPPTPALIRSAYIVNPRDGSDVARPMLTATDAGASATISVAKHDWDYPDGQADVTCATATITGKSFATRYYVYFDDDTLADTTPTYAATTDFGDAQNSVSNPSRHYLGYIITPADGGADTSSDNAPMLSHRLYLPAVNAQSSETSLTKTLNGSNYPDAFVVAEVDITTRGGSVEINCNIPAYLSLGSPTNGVAYAAELALTRGPSSLAIASSDPYDDYLLETDVTELIGLTTCMNYTWAAGAALLSPISQMMLPYIDNPPEGSWKYAVWCRPDTSGHNVATQARRWMKAVESK